METWSAHHLFAKIHSLRDIDIEKVSELKHYTLYLKSKNLPVIFSLKHFSKIVRLPYKLLYQTVMRNREVANYVIFKIAKRSGGTRTIHASTKKLLLIQKYINNDILQTLQPHQASFAFHKSGGIRKCAEKHLGCRWLLKFDLKDFFYSISELKVYKFFVELGYSRCLSFALARICTTTYLPKDKLVYLEKLRSLKNFNEDNINKNDIGVLPQGAPTSPMLSNLIARKLDDVLCEYAMNNGFIYTRYADDLTFSAYHLPYKKSVRVIQKEIISKIKKCGFLDNAEKMHVSGPGAKKWYLGCWLMAIECVFQKNYLKW